MTWNWLAKLRDTGGEHFEVISGPLEGAKIAFILDADGLIDVEACVEQYRKRQRYGPLVSRAQRERDLQQARARYEEVRRAQERDR